MFCEHNNLKNACLTCQLERVKDLRVFNDRLVRANNHLRKEDEKFRAERDNLQHQRDAAVIKATREQDKAKQAEATLARAGIECGCGQHHWVCVECVHKPQLAALENERELVEQLLDANPGMREFADKARAATPPKPVGPPVQHVKVGSMSDPRHEFRQNTRGGAALDQCHHCGGFRAEKVHNVDTKGE